MNPDIESRLSNTKITAEQLREYINQTHNINRLIAAHPSSDAEILEEIIDFWGEDGEAKDPETCRLVVRHPNASINILMKHGGEYPEDLLANPYLDKLLADEVSFLDSIPEILSVPSCPANLMEYAASEGGLALKAWLLMNPALPLELRSRLSPTALNEVFSGKLDEFINAVKDGPVKDYVRAYKGTSRPFCLPNFVEFDRSNESHRKQDQIFTGFPFTSSLWPWPTGKNGQHMQPIVQLDIRNAGLKISEDLGSGLLQIWGEIDSCELFQRIIPPSEFDAPLDNFYPEKAPWLSMDMFGDAEMEGCMISPFPLANYRPFAFDRCRVEWIPFGNMYYPSLTKRVLFPLSNDRKLSEFDEKLEERLEKLDEKLSELAIPTGLNKGINALCTLGGYVDGLGNTWERHSGSLLFYHSIDDGVKVTIGITFERKTDGTVEFSAAYNCDN